MNDRIKSLTIKSSAKIVETVDSKYVIKKNKRDLNRLFDYLKSRNFYSFPKILEEDRLEYKLEYIEDVNSPNEQKMEDLINLIADLHTKTAYFKEVGHDKYMSIYEGLKENILYIEGYYNDLIEQIESEVYMSPSHYLIARNYSKVKAAIMFCKEELEKWYSLVEDSTKQRVCIVHNNLRLSHLLRNNDMYLIGWDSYLIDTPILDLYKFYINESLENNFGDLLRKYEGRFKLLEDEKKLLFIILSIPKKFDYVTCEFVNTNNVREFIDYLYKTNNLIAPYYSIDGVDKEAN